MKYAKNHLLPFLLLLVAFLPLSVFAQDEKRIMEDSEKAKEAFIKTDPGLKKWFTDSYGYVIFPNVGSAYYFAGSCTAGTGSSARK